MQSKLKVLIENQEGIGKILNIVEKSKNQKKLNTYLGNKSLETLNKVMDERLGKVDNLNTNEEYFEQYRNNNKLEITDNGFTISNDTMADYKEYPFSIALAFEFGTGIVGKNAGYDSTYYTPWEYNIHNYNFGWHFTKNGKTYGTYGYQGMEIYRYTIEEIKNNIDKWILEYMEENK